MRTRTFWNRQPWQEKQQPPFAADILGDLTVVTPPSYSILEVPEARLFLRIDDDSHSEDGLIADLIEAATEYCEKAISGHRQFRTAVYDVPVRCWWRAALALPRHPLQGVGSIKRYDSTGALQTLASTVYTVRTPWKAPGEIVLAPDQVWPDFQDDREFPIVIRFTAGYPQGKCPPTIKQAVRMLVTQWYWQRCPMGTPGESANAVRALLDTEGMRYK